MRTGLRALSGVLTAAFTGRRALGCIVTASAAVTNGTAGLFGVQHAIKPPMVIPVSAYAEGGLQVRGVRRKNEKVYIQFNKLWYNGFNAAWQSARRLLASTAGRGYVLKLCEV